MFIPVALVCTFERAFRPPPIAYWPCAGASVLAIVVQHIRGKGCLLAAPIAGAAGGAISMSVILFVIVPSDWLLGVWPAYFFIGIYGALCGLALAVFHTLVIHAARRIRKAP